METLVVEMEELIEDDAMLRLVDSYSPAAQLSKQTAEERCGIDLQRLTLFRLGQVALTGEELDLLLHATRV